MSDSSNGWIKLHRSIIDSKLWSCSDATFRTAVYLLLEANHEPNWWRRVRIERGQCVRSLTRISADCNLSRKAVRYALDVLAEDEFLTIDYPLGAQQGHRITICKYDTYQAKEVKEGTRGAREGNTQGNTQGNTNKNEKNEENEKNTPQTPQGGKSPSRMSKTEKKRHKVSENSELMIRIGRWFGRQSDTLWSIYEAEALDQINPPENVVDGLESYYTAKINEMDIRRKSIETLLNNWNTEVDRAREFVRKQKQQNGRLAL